MNCTCAQFPPLELDRRSINKRSKATAAIIKPLVLLAKNESLKLKLLQCPHCSQHWQTGWEWSIGSRDYAYQVPAIGVEEWLLGPYSQPAAWMIYGAMMQPYYEKNTFEPSEKPCGVAGCPERAIRFSGVCEQHHVEQLQQFGMLPKRPAGRLFLPYGATAPA
jgi:hypothetical protein